MEEKELKIKIKELKLKPKNSRNLLKLRELNRLLDKSRRNKS